MANQKIIKQKEKEVNELADKLKEAKMVLLTDYRGINVACLLYTSPSPRDTR